MSMQLTAGNGTLTDLFQSANNWSRIRVSALAGETIVKITNKQIIMKKIFHSSGPMNESSRTLFVNAMWSEWTQISGPCYTLHSLVHIYPSARRKWVEPQQRLHWCVLCTKNFITTKSHGNKVACVRNSLSPKQHNRCKAWRYCLVSSIFRMNRSLA